MSNPRISGRRGQIVNLDVSFFHNGVLSDPFAIRKVDIYQTQVLPHNLITTFLFVDPEDAMYPAPAVQTGVGKYYLPFLVPTDYVVPDVYFDVWTYFAENPCVLGTGGTGGTGGTVCDLDDPGFSAELLSCCHRFWLYPDGWICGDELHTVNFGFEPLNIHFNKPELKPLEVGLMPLPLYDFDYNLVAPLIPFLNATITIETRNCELLVDAAPMTVGLRQGSYRTNPFVLRYLLNTSNFLVGTYQYRVTIQLPDGTTRTSGRFILTIN